MSQVPSVGRIVLYTLHDADANAINGTHSLSRNTARAGDEYPAMIVRTWGDTPEAAVQLQVFYDGNGSHWATSRVQGDGQGQWHWPPRV